VLNTFAAEEVGLSTERLGKIKHLLHDYVDDGKLPGVIYLVSRRGKVALFDRYGMMDLEAGKPMQDDTIFRIYSMTKPITSVAFMMLYDEGRFDLSDPISEFLPEFAEARVFVEGSSHDLQTTALEHPITIKHLLTHTAGLGYGLTEDAPVEILYQDAKLFDPPVYVLEVHLRELPKLVSSIPLVSQPGTEWRYSVATDLLGCLIEIISGKPLDSFFHERIFAPLDMRDTTFSVPNTKLDRFGALYGPGEQGGMLLLDAPTSSPFAKPTNCLSGGIGLVSTASDYLRFAQMLMNGGYLDDVQILNPKTVELMIQNHIPQQMIPIQVRPHTLDGCGFGLGFRVTVDPQEAGLNGTQGEYGWGGYASTSFFIDPIEQVIGLLLTQLAPSRYYPIRNQFKGLVYQALLERDSR
jgi:CubicO group peptidase (beta-lactamase class C family)